MSIEGLSVPEDTDEDGKKARVRFRLFWCDCLRRAPNLKTMPKLVGLSIASYANVDTGLCFPSQKLLAVELHTTERTIASAVKELREKLWLGIVRADRHKSNSYKLLDVHLEAVDEWYRDEKERLNEERDLQRDMKRRSSRRPA